MVMITYVVSFVPPRSDRRAISAVGYGLIAAALVTIIVAGFSAMGASMPEAVVTVSSDLR